MNIIELLMTEHSALRVHFRYLGVNSDLIYELEDFVRNCHARIEDEVVFPELRKSPDAKAIEKTISRLEADHKLIDTIGDQIKQRTVEGDLDILRKRIQLYANTILSHNASEESSIFGYWNATEAVETQVVSMARKIIESFGFNRYFAITGVSEKLFEKLR